MKKNKIIIALILTFCLVFGLTACSDSESIEDLAKVGETTINSKQLDEYMDLMLFMQNLDRTQIPAESVENLKSSLLLNMVEMEALAQYYKGKDVLPDTAEEDVKKFIADSKAQESINSMLVEKDISDETLTAFFNNQFYGEAFYNEVEKTIKDIDQQAKASYEKNKEQYKVDEVKASHILFEEADKKTGEKVLKDLKEGKVTFEDMAAKYNKDSTKSTGGDLGFFGKGEMDKAFEKAAFALKVGEMSDLVKSSFGYHIIKVTDKNDGYTPYEEAEPQIKSTIVEPFYTEKINKVIDEIGVEYLTDLKPTEEAKK